MVRGGEHLQCDYPTLMRDVGYYAGWTRDPANWQVEDREDIINDIVQAGLKQFYFPPPVGNGEGSYAWGFLRPQRTINCHLEVSSTLSADPVLSGNEITVESATNVFTSDMVGDPIHFTASDQRFTITEYLAANRVGIATISKDEKDTSIGNYVKGTPEGEPGGFDSATVSSTDISDATNTPFKADMVGDLINFSGTTYRIIQFFSKTKVRVEGDASGESGAFTIDRSATSTAITSPFGSVSSITLSAPVVRSDMDVVPDTVVFTLTSNSYNVSTADDGSVIYVTGDATGETATDTVTIKRTGTATTISSVYEAQTLHATDEIFKDSHIGMYVSFENNPSVAYEIVGITNARRAVVAGNIKNESGDFGIIHQIGTVSIAPVFSSSSTTLTVSESIFTTTLAPAGKFIHFKDTGRKYSIQSRTSDTVVVLSGNAGGESSKYIWVAGAITQNEDDAFTLPNTGGDLTMPPDFGGSIIGDITFAPTITTQPIKIISESQIRTMRQNQTATSRPRYAALRPKAKVQSHSTLHGPTIGKFGQVFELMLFPAPDATYSITFKMVAVPLSIGDEYPIPLGGAIHGETIKASCLAEAESRLNDERGEKWDMFMRRLASSIAVDKDAMTPEFLGYNSDGPSVFGRGEDLSRHADTNPTVTYNGVTI